MSVFSFWFHHICASHVCHGCVSYVSYHIEFPVSCPEIFIRAIHLGMQLMKKNKLAGPWRCVVMKAVHLLFV